jgi:hypothetical protein
MVKVVGTPGAAEAGVTLSIFMLLTGSEEPPPPQPSAIASKSNTAGKTVLRNILTPGAINIRKMSLLKIAQERKFFNMLFLLCLQNKATGWLKIEKVYTKFMIRFLFLHRRSQAPAGMLVYRMP